MVALADLAESRDANTGGHVRRVALTEAIAMTLKELGKFTPAFFLMSARILHDMGKVATPMRYAARRTPPTRDRWTPAGESVLACAAKWSGACLR